MLVDDCLVFYGLRHLCLEFYRRAAYFFMNFRYILHVLGILPHVVLLDYYVCGAFFCRVHVGFWIYSGGLKNYLLRSSSASRAIPLLRKIVIGYSSFSLDWGSTFN
jgi:hypothetical protein